MVCNPPPLLKSWIRPCSLPIMYRKTTFTGLYTKWDSFTPRKYKINLIRTLTYRCLRICSSSSLLQSALFDLKKTLLQNGYPRGVLCYNINHVLNRQKNKSAEAIATVPKKDIFLVLPFLGSQSEVLARRVKSCVSKFYGFDNLRIIFNNTCRIKSFFPYKDRINRSQRSKVVYRANCWDCDSFYVGKTKRRLHDRKTEHFRLSHKVVTLLPWLTMSSLPVTTSNGTILISSLPESPTYSAKLTGVTH